MNLPALTRPSNPARVPPEQLRYLGFAHEIEEGGPPRLASTVVYTIAALLLAGVAWSAITPVHQVAVAPGQVIPSGSIPAVQHLEGGIVARVVAADGMLVGIGDPILELDGAAAMAELNALKSREKALAAQFKRLTAFAHGGELRGSLRDNGAAEAMTDIQSSILDAQRQSRDQQRAVLERQMASKRAELATLHEQVVLARRQAALAVQEREARRELFEKGLTTRSAFIESQRADNRAQSDLAEITGQVQRTAEAILESEARLRELDARLFSDAEVEAGQVWSDLAQVRDTLAKLQDRADRLIVRAPTTGRVKDLKAKTAGSVIAPGMIVAEIVPQNQRLLVEARVSPRDIGHAKPGQPVLVKVETYAFSTYGSIPGRLEQIAASTTADTEGALYYKATITLDRSAMGDAPDRQPLKAGMTVQADIVTGERSVLRYLLAPVQTALAGAFREN